jgi:hypothetical protein
VSVGQQDVEGECGEVGHSTDPAGHRRPVTLGGPSPGAPVSSRPAPRQGRPDGRPCGQTLDPGQGLQAIRAHTGDGQRPERHHLAWSYTRRSPSLVSVRNGQTP